MSRFVRMPGRGVVLLLAAACVFGAMHGRPDEPAIAMQVPVEGQIVLVEFEPPAAAPGAPDGRRAKAYAIAARQDAILAEVGADERSVTHRYGAVAGMALRASAEMIERLVRHPLVRSVTPSVTVHADLIEAAALVHAVVPRDVLGYTGDGVTVAVIDTGIDTDHPDLADDIAYERCYLVSFGCVGGTTSASGPGAAEDGHGHGTHISGIITSKGIVAPEGIAPDAQIAAYRVLDNTGTGSIADIVAALDDIALNHPTIRVVNLSLSDGVSHTSACDTYVPMAAAAINAIRANGGLTFSSSGNNGYTSGIGWPACVTNTVAVGAVWDKTFPSITFGPCTQTPATVDTVACFSNSSADLDLLAPGAFITAPSMGGGQAEYGGTSQASPVAAAVAAMLWDFHPSRTPASMEAVLTSTGPQILDARNLITRTRVDAAAAISAMTPPPVGGASEEIEPSAVPDGGRSLIRIAFVLAAVALALATFRWRAERAALRRR